MVIHCIVICYSCLVTVSSELTILQVNFDWLFFLKYITWQLSKMCFICHFWQITQSGITLHPTLAFGAVEIHVAIRKPFDITSFFLPDNLLNTSLCFENCCILLIYLSILRLHLSCYAYVPPLERGFIKSLAETQGNHIICSMIPIHIFPMSSKCLHNSYLQTFCLSVPFRSQVIKHPQILFCIIICAELPKKPTG